VGQARIRPSNRAAARHKEIWTSECRVITALQRVEVLHYTAYEEKERRAGVPLGSARGEFATPHPTCAILGKKAHTRSSTHPSTQASWHAAARGGLPPPIAPSHLLRAHLGRWRHKPNPSITGMSVRRREGRRGKLRLPRSNSPVTAAPLADLLRKQGARASPSLPYVAQGRRPGAAPAEEGQPGAARSGEEEAMQGRKYPHVKRRVRWCSAARTGGYGQRTKSIRRSPTRAKARL